MWIIYFLWSLHSMSMYCHRSPRSSILRWIHRCALMYVKIRIRVNFIENSNNTVDLPTCALHLLAEGKLQGKGSLVSLTVAMVLNLLDSVLTCFKTLCICFSSWKGQVANKSSLWVENIQWFKMEHLGSYGFKINHSAEELQVLLSRTHLTLNSRVKIQVSYGNSIWTKQNKNNSHQFPATSLAIYLIQHKHMHLSRKCARTVTYINH